jgi:hypothetical protein
MQRSKRTPFNLNERQRGRMSSALRRSNNGLQVLSLIAWSLIGWSISTTVAWSQTQPPAESAASTATASSDSKTRTDNSSSSAEQLRQSIANAAQQAVAKQTYELQYQLKSDRKYVWDVEHTFTTKTRMSSTYDESSARSTSRHSWHVVSVDSLGQMTFDHSVARVKSWSKQGENQPVEYDSQSTEKPPLGYETIHERIGRTIKTVTLDRQGKVISKRQAFDQTKFGLGEIAIPLPSGPVAIGHKWNVPIELTAKDEHDAIRKLAGRVVYELKKVDNGKAYLAFRTEILTPLDSEKVRSQIMQDMTRGYAIFDMHEGLFVYREVNWDEKVQGYEGPESFLHYVAKLTETYVPSPDAVAASPTALQPMSAVIKTKDSQPVMRK